MDVAPNPPDALKRLGESIGRAMRDAVSRSPGRREDYTRCAEQVLSTDADVANIRPRQILEHLVAGSSDIASLQFQSRFSDLQLMLHGEDDFVVQLLFWTNATTSIHDHFFAGAFRVVEGSSLHCRYGFSRSGGSTDFGWGRLALEEAELLAAGDVRRVDFGASTIHSVFHLEIPSVSLLIASSLIHPGERQLEYFGGGLAVDMAETDHFLSRRLQALKILAASEPLSPHLIGFLQTAGARTIHGSLVALDPEIARLDPSQQRQIEEAVLRHPAGERILAAVRAEKIVSRLMLMRRRVQDPLARFILALMLNVPEPERWPALVAERLRRSGPGDVGRALADIFADPFWTRIAPERDVEAFVDRLSGHLTGASAALDGLRRDPLSSFAFPLADAVRDPA